MRFFLLSMQFFIAVDMHCICLVGKAIVDSLQSSTIQTPAYAAAVCCTASITPDLKSAVVCWN